MGERAHAIFPGGVLIDREPHQVPEKLADTRAALQADVPAILEASFVEDDVFVAVDALARLPRAHALVEVKSTLDVKDQHIPDVAIQLHVARRAGLDVQRAELMHLNRECRAPELSNLFLQEDVTARAEAFLPEIPSNLARMQAAISGDIPSVAIGPQSWRSLRRP